MGNRFDLNTLVGAALLEELTSFSAFNDAYAAPCRVYEIEIVNNNSQTRTYTKLYNSAAPVIGTTTPTITFPCTQGSTVRMTFPKGIPFQTKISFATVTDGSGTAGTAFPALPVFVRIIVGPYP